jgi:hypothetical protein
MLEKPFADRGDRSWGRFTRFTDDNPKGIDGEYGQPAPAPFISEKPPSSEEANLAALSFFF